MEAVAICSEGHDVRYREGQMYTWDLVCLQDKLFLTSSPVDQQQPQEDI
jgi:hypothetical protein